MTNPLRSFSQRAVLVFGGALFSACASPTALNTQWVDPQFAGKPPMHSILVLGNTKDPTHRRLFVRQMGAPLATRGAQAEPSYRLATDGGAMAQVLREWVVQETGVAGVLLSRVAMDGRA